MLVSLSWLRALCPVDAGASEIARALTARGLTVDDDSSVGSDTVFDVDVPANRPDCLGHLGLARELAAAFAVPLRPRPEEAAVAGEPAERVVRVFVDSPDLCPRYTARLVRGVRVGPSPPWVVERLESCGLRSINNVVDASNLVLLELSQPIHTFDLDLLNEPTVRVRRAAPGETLTTLDGEERTLGPDMLVIADGRRPVALAGVMGGADSEIRESTTNVLIEAAAFLPAAVRTTARALEMKSDASHRFERGVDIEGIVEAQEMACRLLAELAGGTPAPGIVDIDNASRPERELVLRLDRVRLLLGFDPGEDSVRSALEALDLQPKSDPGEGFRVVPPSWRPDLQREADLVEEVARHMGYDGIPSHLPPAPGVPAVPSEVGAIVDDCRDTLAGFGFSEAYTYSMVAEGEDDPYVPDSSPTAIVLDNPIAEHLSRMRRSLLPGLVRSADLNLRRGTADVRLFEVGRIFEARPQGGLPREPLHAGWVWAGAAAPCHWGAPSSTVGFHDVAGVVEAVLESLRPRTALAISRADLSALHPGRSATWKSEGRSVATAGELHPTLRSRLDLSESLFIAEIDLSALLRLPLPEPRHTALPRVPAVSRDLSVVIPEDVAFTRVLEVLESVTAPAPATFCVIDRYAGKGLEPNEAALTVRGMLQPLEKSLTDPEIEAWRAELVRALQAQLGIRIRS
jgi:phenylalanyl-tRNA synthetase beta chain